MRQTDRDRAIAQIRRRLGSAIHGLRPAELEQEIQALLRRPRR